METIARYLSRLFIRPEVDKTADDVRASKEHITHNDNGGTELPLSVLTVMSSDDLLTEILLRLPVISLVLFKTVSKQWLSLIKDTTFMIRRSQIPNIDPPSGIYFCRPVNYYYQYGFRRLDIRIPVRSFLFKNTFKIGSKEEVGSNALVSQSCNGLLLCNVRPDHKYYVYNPTVKMFNMIPQPSKSNVKPRYGGRMIMCFDPTKSPHYKVVYATNISDVHDGVVSIQIQTYSSETRSWSAVCSDPLSSRCFPCFENGIYWNDAIHWLSRALHYKIGIVNKIVVLTKIQLPVTLDEKLPWDRKLYESRGSLLLLGKDSTHYHQLNVYEMRNGHSEWSLKYFVNLDDILMPISKEWRIRDGVSCIALGEREEDSFMVIGSGLVIESDAMTIQYNFGLKTYRDLSDPKLFFLPGSFLFTASFAGV